MVACYINIMFSLSFTADSPPPGYQVIDDRSMLGSPASVPSPQASTSNGGGPPNSNEDMDHQQSGGPPSGPPTQQGAASPGLPTSVSSSAVCMA